MQNNVRYYRKKLKLTIEALADKVGASASIIHKVENGDRNLEPWRDKLAAALGCEPDDLDVHAPEEQQTIPIVGYVGAGGSVFPYDDHCKGQGLADADVPPYEHTLNLKKTVAVEVRGDSMMPFIGEGFRLFYDARVVGVAYEYVNCICVVWLDNGQCLVKWVRQGSKAGHYNLESINPNDPPIKDALVQWSAKVKNIVPQ